MKIIKENPNIITKTNLLQSLKRIKQEPNVAVKKLLPISNSVKALNKARILLERFGFLSSHAKHAVKHV